RHAISQGDVECVVHEQDLAYRSGTATTQATQTTPRSSGGSDLLVDADGRFAFDPVQVFRFSALTRNAHRIHYDADYARADEGYPGLVVQGPLLILTMLETPRRSSKPPPTSVQYRLDAPVYVGDGCHIAGSGSEGRATQLRLAARDIDPCATADLRWN
ncbi:MAG TPA: hypothetical protein VLK34_09965, partial [Nocardioidaceae bacterium]|nr:hypothetical protein [Nocardioidaceae bacterium]